ncbi:MAG: type II secretion system protein GspL [Nevskiales bacterium]|nr:type II secretion system protein GspL [Nevskiales bacterium]
MRDILYLQLRTPSEEVPLAYAQAGVPATSDLTTQHATLDDILKLAPGRQLVMFVPGIEVRLTSVQVPARQLQKVLQAAPYALEDQLADDVDTLHFAIGPRQTDDAHPVAITARERMECWLAPLRARGLVPDAIIPETLCLPLPSEPWHWTALVDADRITVRTGAFSGFVCTLDELPATVSLADPEGRASLQIHLPRDNEHDFTALNRPVNLLPGHDSTLSVLTRNWRPETAINLLQGAYSQKEDWRGRMRPWKMVGALAAVWAVLTLLNTGVQTIRLRGELRAQETKNLERFQTLFPDETKIVDLAAQIEQQWTALHENRPAPLFELIEVLSASLTAHPGLTLQSLQFRDGALYMNLTASDLQVLENLRSWYGARRDTALEVQAANAGSAGVQIRLKLSAA